MHFRGGKLDCVEIYVLSYPKVADMSWVFFLVYNAVKSLCIFVGSNSDIVSIHSTVFLFGGTGSLGTALFKQFASSGKVHCVK